MRARTGDLREDHDLLASHLSVVASRLDDLTPLPRAPVVLEIEEKQRMQAAWTSVSCVYCGMAHGGTCTRVRRMEFSTVGQNVVGPTRVWFWPDGKWEPPPDALTVEDVFGQRVGPGAPPRGDTNG